MKPVHLYIVENPKPEVRLRGEILEHEIARLRYKVKFLKHLIERTHARIRTAEKRISRLRGWRPPWHRPSAREMAALGRGSVSRLKVAKAIGGDFKF